MFRATATRRLSTAAIATIAAMAAPLAAASAAPAATVPAHAFQLSTHTVAFGPQNTGSTTTKSVTFTNSGTKALHPVQVLSGPSSISLSANTCDAVKVMPAKSCSYTVSFAPTAAGAAAGILQVLTTEGTKAQAVALSGTGVQQVMEHYFYQYSFTNPPVINGVAAAQSFTGDGFAPAGTYTLGQTVAVYDFTGLNQIGTYRIGNVDNTIALNPATLNTVDVSSYTWGATHYTTGTGLIDRQGVSGLGSEGGVLAGMGVEGTGASFNDHQPAIVAHHF